VLKAAAKKEQGSGIEKSFMNTIAELAITGAFAKANGIRVGGHEEQN
jgi:hypothetical protein